MAADQNAPRLAVLWASGLHEINQILIFLADRRGHSAALLEIDRHLRSSGTASSSLQGARDLAQLANCAG